ncbi:AGAP006619-PA-like protein [Anopheles sinensis]|uniref:AGAP006619-PA-like protein n=1 Tax=Anopheles sinensis TaxID=74873 RepID=A0A084WGK3_ANOSI|nr:AGAP006619-PA-like protein [Anopheles sinensis]
MGKLNKKILKHKIAKSSVEDATVKGPFPIYRSTPVQLNGPEPKSFKIIDRKPKPKAKPKLAEPQNSEPSTTDTNDRVEGQKEKKLRKLAISRLSKKEKKQFRKDEMLKKIELTKEAFKKDKERKKREKTAITGDLRPLLDALPSLDSLFEIKASTKLKTGVPQFDKKPEPKSKKSRRAFRMKQRKREFITRCTAMKQVINDKKFQKDPKKAIAEHIKNTRKEQLALLMGTTSS